MKRLNFLIAASVIAIAACAGSRGTSVSTSLQSDTITVSGKYLDVPMKVTVVVPDSYLAEGDTVSYPVLYLLNGYGGSYKNWGMIAPLAQYANDYGCIIVCPSGMNSWYWDSPEKPGMQMESFIIKELIPHIDSNYRTRTDRLGRAVTGFSMGGHGGLWLGIRHSDVFGSAGATSGGVNIIPFPNNWDMKKWIGEYEKNPDRWEAYTVKNLIDSLKPDQLNIIFDCGTEDFFYKVNCDLDSALNARKIPHTYITSPGAHNAKYWSKSIVPQLQYFKRIWDSNK
ncbi:MAG: esterase family protein [Paramuribaculum sp.]|nr:esterase family protein [Paramuribaculum sp.]